jgi:hypothetical protein
VSLAARVQRRVVLRTDRWADGSARFVAAFRKGLNETSYIEGQNVTAEYHWLEGQYDRLPTLMDDLVRRQVAVIATPGALPRMSLKFEIPRTIPRGVFSRVSGLRRDKKHSVHFDRVAPVVMSKNPRFHAGQGCCRDQIIAIRAE